MKTYVIILSKTFPQTHPKAGKLTHFAGSFRNAQTCARCKKRSSAMCLGECFSRSKRHTVRENFRLWEKRIKEVREGKAVLSIRQWEDKPYRSKQVEIARLTAQDGVGIQKLTIEKYLVGWTALIDGNEKDTWPLDSIARNDGLELADWKRWFWTLDRVTDYAIIHFTNFRYQ